MSQKNSWSAYKTKYIGYKEMHLKRKTKHQQTHEVIVFSSS